MKTDAAPADQEASVDVAVVGAGAAGLATAIFAARRLGPGRVLLLDTASRPGAKILVSGGGRCNVTNRVVVDRDFSGGPPHLVRRVLRAFTADETVAFFREIGVALHEEEHGKLFPDSHKARTVLDALLVEAARRGVDLRAGRRVTGLQREGNGFVVAGEAARSRARRVVLATGGLSLPKTGSDGGGYAFVGSLGHTLVPATPALVPLVLEGRFHEALSGVAQEVELKLVAVGARPIHVGGSLLWTHFGASGPAILDVSRHFLRARLEGREPRLHASLLPGLAPDAAEELLLDASRRRPRAGVGAVLEGRLSASVVEAVCQEQGIASAAPLSQVPRETRKRLVSGLTARELIVRDSRGYNFAEVTAGGVPLEEVDLRTMESRRCPGLYLVGEILDVDGRLGGFNFQWAWSSAHVAAQALAAGEEAAIMRPGRGDDKGGFRVSMATFRYRISGRVQGVGYRYFALIEAQVLGVAGYAKNLPDGSVEVVAEGSDEAVQAFEGRLREGPAFCRVEIVDRAPLGTRGDHGFHIR